MIGGMLGRINTAEQMTVEQLQDAVSHGSLPAYIAVPILQEKLQMRDRAMAIPMGAQLAQQPPIMDEILQKAKQSPNVAQEVAGINRLPSQLSPAAGLAQGGIVAFPTGGLVDPYTDEQRERARSALSSMWDTLSGMFGRSIKKDEQNAIIDRMRAKGATIPDPDAPSPADALAKAHNDVPGSIPMGSVVPTANASSPADSTVVPPKDGVSPRPSAGIDALPTSVPASAVGDDTVPAQPATSPLQQYIDLLMKDRDGASNIRGNALGQSLMQAGLATMAGQSPNALQNVGAGGLAGIQAYNKAISDANKMNRQAVTDAAGLAGAQEQIDVANKRADVQDRFNKDRLELEKRKINLMAQKVSAAGNPNTNKIAALAGKLFSDSVKGTINATPQEIEALKQQALRTAMQFYGMAPMSAGDPGVKSRGTYDALTGGKK